MQSTFITYTPINCTFYTGNIPKRLRSRYDLEMSVNASEIMEIT